MKRRQNFLAGMPRHSMIPINWSPLHDLPYEGVVPLSDITWELDLPVQTYWDSISRNVSQPSVCAAIERIAEHSKAIDSVVARLSRTRQNREAFVRAIAAARGGGRIGQAQRILDGQKEFSAAIRTVINDGITAGRPIETPASHALAAGVLPVFIQWLGPDAVPAKSRSIARTRIGKFFKAVEQSIAQTFDADHKILRRNGAMVWAMDQWRAANRESKLTSKM